MNWKILNQRTWLNLISAIILLVGLGSSILIYQRAGNDPYGALWISKIPSSIDIIWKFMAVSSV